MKTIVLLEDQISATDREKFKECLEMDADAFSNAVRKIGLNPTTDFRYSDLSHADFSHSDLRGYDFTGANLKGCAGVDITWDSTTSFDGADLDGSSFAHSQNQKRFFAANQRWTEFYDRLVNEGWYSASRYVLSKRGENVSLEEGETRIAQRIIDESTDLTVRNSLMYTLRNFFASPKDYQDYLRHVLASKADDINFLERSINSLVRNLEDSEETFNTLFLFLKYDRFELQIKVLDGMSRSKFYDTRKAEIDRFLLSDKCAGFRKTLVQRVSSELGGPFPRVFNLLGENDEFVDYGKAIEVSQIIFVLRDFVLRRKRAEMASRGGVVEAPMTAVSEGALFAEVPDLVSLLREFQNRTGITLQISSDASRRFGLSGVCPAELGVDFRTYFANRAMRFREMAL